MTAVGRRRGCGVPMSTFALISCSSNVAVRGLSGPASSLSTGSGSGSGCGPSSEEGKISLAGSRVSESSCTTTASGSLVIVPGTGQSMTAVWMHRRLLSSARSCCTRHGAVISSGDPHLRLHQTIDRITMLHATGCCISACPLSPSLDSQCSHLDHRNCAC
eukprot:COSAG02_NODE_10023_length_2046_cov_1.370827_2_plen_161_part_00